MRELVGLVVFPHFLQHLLDAALVWHLSVEGDAHEVGHPVQQAGHTAQLLPGVLRAVGPGVVDEEHAVESLGAVTARGSLSPSLSHTHTHIEPHARNNSCVSLEMA